MTALVVTGALCFLLGVAVTLVVLWQVAEPMPVRPVRVSMHSLEDHQRRADPQQSTSRLMAPPDLKHGGVVGRPRSVFLGEDGEWVGQLKD